MVHILVVDDNKKLNQTVCTYLDDCGFHAKGVLGASEAYDKMYNTLYDLIISDIMMPEIDGKEIAVTTREFNILYKLLSYPNKTFTRAQLMDEFWGIDSGTSLRAVDVYVTKLRDKFSGCDGFAIKTVRGIGYKAVLL